MYAIIRLGKGEYYISVVFGYYCVITATDDHQRYLEGIHNQYYLVLNKEKNKLVKQYIFDKNSKYLEPSVLIVDCDQDNWNVDSEGYGGIDFLTDISQDNIEDEIPAALLNRCIQIDADYHYNEYPVIKSQADVDNLMSVSGYFHDAYIDKFKEYDDGSVFVTFDGVWGCSIEVWFSGNVSYSIKSRDPEEYDPYWFGSTVLIEDGFVYFVDDDDMEVEDIGDGYCWFKARNMRYHVIPDE